MPMTGQVKCTPFRKVTEVSDNLGLPEDKDITSLSADDLAQFTSNAQERFNALLDSEPTDPAQAKAEVAEMRELSASINRAGRARRARCGEAGLCGRTCDLCGG
jgi:hypothetical protein